MGLALTHAGLPPLVLLLLLLGVFDTLFFPINFSYKGALVLFGFSSLCSVHTHTQYSLTRAPRLPS